ncbi:MAG TPA: OB-fold domain-containing protein [Solirubrobacteraceae bacterium]|nr:OB-fold domain-containing protein [Solirubrobacteraceae bacterium]
MTEATRAHRGTGGSPLTAGFWDAAAHRTLVRPVCAACGKNFFSPQIACPRCLSEEWVYEPSSGRGTIYSATVVHRAPYPGVTAPYRLAIVDLEEGWSMLATVDGDPLAPLAIGTPVRVGWRTGADGRVIPVFAVDPGSDPGM